MTLLESEVERLTLETGRLRNVVAELGLAVKDAKRSGERAGINRAAWLVRQIGGELLFVSGAQFSDVLVSVAEKIEALS